MRQCPLGFFEVPLPHGHEPLCLLISSFEDEELISPKRTPAEQREFCERLGSRALSLEATYPYTWLKDNIGSAFPTVSCSGIGNAAFNWL